MALVVDRLSIGQRKKVEVLDRPPQWRDLDVVGRRPEGDAGQIAPVKVSPKTVQQLYQRNFAVEPNNRIQPRCALENLRRFKTGVVAAHREMGSYVGLAQFANYPGEIRSHVLKDQG